MVKKSSFKQRYLELENVRVTYDHKFDKIHITAKDPDIPEGFHLTLNSGRDAEQSLRRVLTEHKLIRKPESHTPENIPADPFLFHLANGRDETICWDFKASPFGIIAGRAGRVRILENLVNHFLRYGDEWSIYAVNMRSQKMTKQIEENEDKFTATAFNRDNALNVLSRLCEQTRQRKVVAEKEDADTYHDCETSDPTPVLIIDDIDALLEIGPGYNGDLSYDTEMVKSVKNCLDYIQKNHEVAGVKIVYANRTNSENLYLGIDTLEILLGTAVAPSIRKTIDDDTIGVARKGSYGPEVSLTEIP